MHITIIMKIHPKWIKNESHSLELCKLIFLYICQYLFLQQNRLEEEEEQQQQDRDE